MNLTKQQFLNIFPYPNIRTHQLEVLNKLYDNWDKYDNFIIQAPTGTGKSALAYTICEAVEKGMILTSTKLLQDQYRREFSNIHCVKGRSAYSCIINEVYNCDNGLCRRNNFELPSECKQCLYTTALNKIKNNITVLTNYACLISNEVIRKRKNDVIVFDEAHTLEDTLVQIQAFVVDKEKLIKKYNLDDYIDELENNMIFTGLTFKETNKQLTYKKKTYPQNIVILKVIYDLLQIKQKNLPIINKSDEDIQMEQDIIELSNKLKKYLDTYNSLNWVVNVKDKNTLIIQPLDVSILFKNLTKNSNKKIFMSATIISVDQFIKIFGLDATKTAYIEVPETFNPLYAPIVSYPVGNMSYNEIQNTVPYIINAITTLLEVHKNDKGIILTNNYNITEQIVKKIKSKRFIHKYEKAYYNLTNEEMYYKHINSKKPTVLISPSMNTGVDLPNEQSRFQIIVKMPYPSLADKRIAYKLKTDRDWYLTQMIRTFVQSCGRSVRNEKDWAVTYVLDGSFLNVIQQNKNKLTNDFQSRIVHINNFDLDKFLDVVNTL